MMEKQFVIYDIASQFKELGFDEECFGYYAKPYTDERIEFFYAALSLNVRCRGCLINAT